MTPVVPGGDAFGALVAAGLGFLQQLQQTDGKKGGSGLSGLGNLIETDKKTGKTHLKIPVKDKETVVNVIRAFADLLEG